MPHDSGFFVFAQEQEPMFEFRGLCLWCSNDYPGGSFLRVLGLRFLFEEFSRGHFYFVSLHKLFLDSNVKGSIVVWYQVV